MERKILITSALPYVNNIPHLGNIVGCVLPADVYSRYCKQRGYNNLFICGSDDLGTTSQVRAYEENMTPFELCEKYRAIHKDIYKWFQIDFDYFGQTATKDPLKDLDWNHTKISQEIFTKLADNDYLVEEESDQLFCPELDIFLADRYITGTCPLCGYENAKGDQCDKCGQLLNGIDLINPKYKFNEKFLLIKKKTWHLFLDLPKLEPIFREWYERVKNNWSQNAVDVTDAWLKNGLQKRCITRDIKWGTPVPDTQKYGQKYKTKVMYNWFDACLAYLSITSCFTDKWKEWWTNPQTELVQFFSKDNIVYHSIIFSSSLIGTNDNYILPHKISCGEYLNYQNKKFSKSENVGIFGDDVMNCGIESDYWRFYLMYQRPEIKDTDFTWQDFQAKINGELVNNFGNLVQRVLILVKKYFDFVIPNYDPQQESDYDKKFILQIEELSIKYLNKMENTELKYALQDAFSIAHFANKYIVHYEPWKLIKNNKKEQANNCISILVHIVGLLNLQIKPFMPETSKKITSILGFESGYHLILNKFSGIKINEPEIWFNKIEDDVIFNLESKYG